MKMAVHQISPCTERIFWSRVDKRERRDCWLWQGGTSAQGYGQLSVRGKPWLTHRIAWMIKHQIAVPDGKRVIVKCGNKRCCNPSHLRLGTHKDHAAKGDKSGRRTKPEAWASKSDCIMETLPDGKVSIELSVTKRQGRELAERLENGK